MMQGADGDTSSAPLCDGEAAAHALRLVAPLLEAACRDPELGDSAYLYVVIMNPVRPPRVSRFEEAVLYEASFGAARDDAQMYARFARAKAELSWRHGCDTSELQQARPHCLSVGDTSLGGSVVLDGLVVAASGCHAVYDEALGGAIAMCLRGIVKARAEAQRRAGHLFFIASGQSSATAATVRQKGSTSCNG